MEYEGKKESKTRENTTAGKKRVRGREGEKQKKNGVPT